MNQPQLDLINLEQLAPAYDQLSLNGSLNSSLDALLEIIQARYPDIGRISVATYDHKSNILKSFLSSEGKNDPLARLEVSLTELSEILRLKSKNSKRIIRQLNQETNSYTAQALLQKGYCSSYILPLFDQQCFHGIITFTSTKKDRFDQAKTQLQIDIAAKLISLMIISNLYAIRGLKGTVKTLKEIATIRDNETGAHIERMSRFSRLIAKELASEKQLDDEFIEDLFQSAPLHDVGKIATPDSILLKEGKLTADEFDTMKMHAEQGKDIIEKALKNLHIENKTFCRILLNIVYSHHENWDGSGYPQQLSGEAIPLEARIIRVADVFDALTSCRPYKNAWTTEETKQYLQHNSGSLFDPDCVKAAITLIPRFKEISNQFSDLDTEGF
jgi:HD-GYP domain-containing protein (c-di-GMP phosphodiesterase class II)